MNLLVTGGAGFIGSNFISYMLSNVRNDLYIVNLDKLTYAGNLRNVEAVENDPRYSFVHGDICDENLVAKIFENYKIDGVIHFAAESHVDKSIENPRPFLQSNIIGTYTLLEAARNYWMDGIGVYKKGFAHARFHHISTDEVYGSLGKTGHFTEETKYAPNSPYSASKASADMIVRSYFETFGLNVVTTNCSNNFGPRQHDEKLIPTIIRRALALKPIPIYGNGENVRDWLFVTEHCRAIEKVFVKGKAGETYVIGGHNERKNIEIATMICEVLDQVLSEQLKSYHLTSYKELIQYVSDRPGHDFRYAIDDRKLCEELGFVHKYSLQEGMEQTVSYYLKKYVDGLEGAWI
ncbi:dTDP-glucose 4,6-dehydratase [Robertmurraya siralis]|uniref:dTDP-glucose 4,6-dehydratase n=1 Tax=Robertmurraya siralis TaxID=77777 RepID=A0A920BTI1_9BACI|nr:dTDP-glucose 4,6-dehydratase [Robertmurraya siralis]PAE18655.1 dTDP-glucose 4,6-dehydratase [Bacillus sp. 7504-2]GIN61998.1 dTDP-glucose 4,6-dehydratase [Robertmurraya siralis]